MHFLSCLIRQSNCHKRLESMIWRRVGCRVRGDLWIFAVHREYVLPEQQIHPADYCLRTSTTLPTTFAQVYSIHAMLRNELQLIRHQIAMRRGGKLYKKYNR
jgi:hypothetical protein